MRFLIAGFGSIGRRHFRNLLALGEGNIVFYRTGRSTLPEEELNGFPVLYEIQAALDYKPDAVIVANPTALHLEVAIPAAEAGCSLLLEKPISHSLEGVDELKSALQRGGRKALVGFQFRFHPGLQMVKKLLTDGVIGKPLAARAAWGEYLPAWHPWEDYRQGYAARSDLGGGVVLTLCHPCDSMRWLMGEVVELRAMTGKVSDLELQVEDVAEVSLRFASGALGSVHVDYFGQPPVHRLYIYGSDGRLEWNNSDGAVHYYAASTGEWKICAIPEDFERNQLFVDEMKHFIEVAQGKAEPLCTLDDGIRALEIAQEILKQGREHHV
jgi:predicted dehydrogenase